MAVSEENSKLFKFTVQVIFTKPMIEIKRNFKNLMRRII